MKLDKGQVVYVGNEKFIDEIPDEKAVLAGLKKKPKQQDPEVTAEVKQDK